MACTCLAWKVIYKDRCSKPIFRPFFRLCYKKSHNLRNVESTGRISDYKNKKAYDITYEGLANCNNKVKHYEQRAFYLVYEVRTNLAVQPYSDSGTFLGKRMLFVVLGRKTVCLYLRVHSFARRCHSFINQIALNLKPHCITGLVSLAIR